VNTFAAESWTAGVMILEDWQEALLVADVEQATSMQVVQSLNIGVNSAHQRDERGHVMRNEERIEPFATFVRLTTVFIEVAGGKIEER
jgi:hypothetical protein